jgi:hypothetical protein
MRNSSEKHSQPGQLIARGVARHLASLGFTSLEEFVPKRVLRVDIMALNPKGELWIIECKSSRADFASDGKWENYLEWADRFFWTVDERFPIDIIPSEHGLFVGDAYDAEIIRDTPLSVLAPARRKTLIQKFATQAAKRLHRLRDLGCVG